MHQLEVSELFEMLVVMLVTAKVVGELAQRIGQPAVLGELIGGILVGASAMRLVDPHVETIHMLSELGVVILLLAIGRRPTFGRCCAWGGRRWPSRSSASCCRSGWATPRAGCWGWWTSRRSWRARR